MYFKIEIRKLRWLLLGGLFVTTVSPAAEQYECLIQAHNIVELGSPVSGILRSVEVERGDSVRAKQVVARLDSRAEAARVELASARAEFARRKESRNTTLFEDDLMSAHERDEVSTERRLSELELAEARTLMDMKTIESPIDGVIVERYRAPGELVQTDPILQVAGIDPLFVEVVLPVADFGKVDIGSIANVLPENPVGGEYKAKVTVVDPIVDAASGTFGVRLELPNPEHAIPAGLKCSVEFTH